MYSGVDQAKGHLSGNSSEQLRFHVCKGLHPDSAAELADLVRVMNCYYSNLIEGHNTRPRDIERALAGAELEEETRPLALEARAHVIVGVESG